MAIDKRVRDAGLRPTRQRVALAEMLFAKGDRHLSAEELHEEALAAGVPVSLATVYNALHQFTERGTAAHPGGRRVEDLFRHQHVRPPPFLHRRREQGVRHPEAPVRVTNLPEPPEGMEIVNVDIVVRLRRTR